MGELLAAHVFQPESSWSQYFYRLVGAFPVGAELAFSLLLCGELRLPQHQVAYLKASSFDFGVEASGDGLLLGYNARQCRILDFISEHGAEAKSLVVLLLVEVL